MLKKEDTTHESDMMKSRGQGKENGSRMVEPLDFIASWVVDSGVIHMVRVGNGQCFKVVNKCINI